MSCLYRTIISSIGPEVEGLLEGGVIILFKEGAPAELAEVSVLHEVESEALGEGVAAGGRIVIGDVSARVTAVGDSAMKKVAELGHVVISFNGASEADRPGEICAEAVDGGALKAALQPGTVIELHSS